MIFSKVFSIPYSQRNANENQSRFRLTPVRGCREQLMTNASGDAGTYLFIHSREGYRLVQPLWKSMLWILRQLELYHRMQLQRMSKVLHILLSGYLVTRVHYHSLHKDRIRKPPKCPLTVEWMKTPLLLWQLLQHDGFFFFKKENIVCFLWTF